MEESDRANMLTAAVTAMAASKAIIRLCAEMAEIGAIDATKMEVLRHLHLLDFDDGISAIRNETIRERLEQSRKQIDAYWQIQIEALQQET